MKINQKITAILMIIILIGTNLIALGNEVLAENLPEQNNEKATINIETNNNAEKQTKLELENKVTKYIPYSQGEDKGVLLQTVINSNVKEHVLVASKTELEMQAPEMNGQKPQRVTVIANQTINTNEQTSSSNSTGVAYQYDETTGKLTIETKNQNQEQANSWNNQASEEYVINFIYVGEEAYNYAIENEFKAQMKVTARVKVNVLNREQTSVEETTLVKYSEKEQKGSLTDVTILADKELSKAYLYLNDQITENKQETPYQVKYRVQINDSNLTNEITLQTIPEQYKKGEETFSVGEGSYIKQIKIAKNNFEQMLSEEGKIKITDKEGNVLGTISTKTEKEGEEEKEATPEEVQEKDGNYVLDISQYKINEISMKTTKPENAGNLEITIEKALTESQNYSKQEVQNFNKITLGVILKNQEIDTKKQQNIETAELQEITDLQETAESQETTNTEKATNSEAKTEISLKEPVSKAEISLEEGKTLSTILENKDVTIRVTLDTSSVYHRLYKNPSIKITLPSYITRVNIQKASLLMNNGLNIKNVKVEKVNNAPVIRVELEGMQTEYVLDADYKGTILELNTDLTVNNLTPTNNSQIQLNYTNQNEPNSNYVGQASAEVEFVAPTGVVAANGIEGYSQNEKAIMTMSAQNVEANLETYTNKKLATVTGKVINNYANQITDVVILGRLPSKDNKKIDSDENLGSTFTASLKSELTVTGISPENYTIYYSEKVDATKDLEDKNNDWKTTATANTKSYMIVTKNYEMQAGEVIDFSYNIEIPANLSYNNSSYEMYKVYYNNISKVGRMAETKISPMIEMATGEGPELELSVKQSSNTTVREGQIVRMTATIKNTGGLKAENAVLKITAPEGTKHTEIKEGTLNYSETSEKEKTISLGTINQGQTITKDYELKIEKTKKVTLVTNAEEGQTISQQTNEYAGDKQIQNIIRVTADNMQNEMKSEAYNLTVLEGDLKLTSIPTVGENQVLQKGSKLGYKIQVENISNNKNLNNVTLTAGLPNGIKINDVYYGEANSLIEKQRENITINGNNITIGLGKLDSLNAYMNQIEENNSDTPQIVKLRTNMYVYIDATIEDITGEFNFVAKATADNTEEHISNISKHQAEKVELSITQKASGKQYMKEGSTTEYQFEIVNNGKISSNQNKMEMVLPEGLKFVKAQYSYQGKTTTKDIANNNNVTITLSELKPGEKLEVIVTVKADMLPSQEEKQVVTKASLEATGFSKTESNSITTIIEYDANAHNTNNPAMPTTPITRNYKITGTAWLDENKNGRRDENEKVLSGILVMLLNKKDSTIVKDRQTGEEKRIKTTNNGSYEFTNIPAGEYLVVFDYDASKYSITNYQAEKIEESLNSDAIDMTMVLDGEKKVVGITDIIKLTDENQRNIDIGLYVAEKFDLRIDKYISKITRTTPTSGTEVFEYRNSKMEKIEVLGKNVNQSTIIVEYKMVVTNEGQVAGYARKIVDYLPEDSRFSTEINSDWYLADNKQAVYNTSLADTIIEPGQSKEVTLTLSFSIADKNIGTTVSNNAEIYESYNEQGIKDIDSVEGNKAVEEDDLSHADIVLSVVTGGQIIIYSSFALAIVILIGIGAFEIRKRVLSKSYNS